MGNTSEDHCFVFRSTKDLQSFLDTLFLGNEAQINKNNYRIQSKSICQKLDHPAKTENRPKKRYMPFLHESLHFNKFWDYNRKQNATERKKYYVFHLWITQGDIGVWSITILDNFSCDISVI